MKTIPSLISSWLMLAIGLFGSTHTAFSRQVHSGWRAGVAKVDITPQESIWMAGYASRDHPSKGVRHAIWAKALVLEDASGNLAVLVTTDLALKNIFGPDIFVMGYSNDVMAYIPTSTVLAEGGYEGVRSPIFTTPWAFDIEDRIIAEAVRLAEKVGIQPQEAPVTDQ